MFKIISHQYSKTFNLNISKNLTNIYKKFFNTPNTPATGKEQQISTQPPKSKEQLKVEALMQQWPEHLKNPKLLEMQYLKEYLESSYKFHQGDKKYLGPFDMPAPILSQMETKINNVKTTESVADFFEKYEGYLPDHFIMRKFYEIATTHGDKTKDLFDVILPQVKKLVLKCDRQNPQVLFYAVEGASWLNLQDKEFWSMIVSII